MPAPRRGCGVCMLRWVIPGQWARATHGFILEVLKPAADTNVETLLPCLGFPVWKTEQRSGLEVQTQRKAGPHLAGEPQVGGEWAYEKGLMIPYPSSQGPRSLDSGTEFRVLPEVSQPG